ncbi:TonB-dependent receptor [Sphingomonas gilva]|uniref:TonB-dependent receptor n=1 Tax=Sphingomonas gilva TaxID=2305907 RepID=A0A396S248_9SPHN|nr:TonB-dependent receptor [Sphingomonas gilva]RHW17455.1 TonB-dependent receptor [Sphingomonas gilva]
MTPLSTRRAFRGTASLFALAFAATFSAGANAQTAQAQSEETAPEEQATDAAPPQADEIIVTGIRASLASASDRKKNAGTTVDSIVAEDVGRFPDRNVGEALSRISGVQLQRDFGEGVKVSIRGVEPDLNRVEVNGATALSSGGDRSGDFRELAAELIKSVDVYKGYQVDLTEGGVGGTVSIQTRRPLELRGPLLSINGSLQNVDTVGSEWKPRGTIVAGTKFLDDRFGVLVNATYDRNKTRGDFIRNTEWVRLADLNGDGRKNTENANFGSISTLAGCDAVPTTTDDPQANRLACQTQFYDFSPRTPRVGLWERDDERWSIDAQIQAELASNLTAFVGFQYNKMDRHLVDYNLGFDLSAVSRVVTGDSVEVDENGNVIGITTAPWTSGGSVVGPSMRDFQFVQDTKYWTAGFKWEVGNLTVDGLAVLSSGGHTNATNNIGIGANPDGVRIQLDPENGAPRFIFPDDFDVTDINSYMYGPGDRTVVSVDWRPNLNEQTEDQFKLDFDWEIEHPVVSSVEFGGQYRRLTSTRYAGGGYLALNDDGTTFMVPTANRDIDAVVNGDPEDFSDTTNPYVFTWSPDRLADFFAASSGVTPGTFFNAPGFNRDNLFDGWATPTFAAVNEFFDTSEFNFDCVRECEGYPQLPAFDISEKITAGYLKFNIEAQPFGMDLRGNIGLRVVRTQDKATGSNIIRERRPANNAVGYEDVEVGRQIISIDNDYTDLLPAFNFALFVTPEVILRADWSRVMARPKFNDLAPNSNCLFDLTPEGSGDGDLDDCSAGNPRLKPYRAAQFNIGAEWYPTRDTSLAVTYYQKNIDSFILSSTLVSNVDFFGDGRVFDVRQPINGEGATQRGVEVSGQTAFTFLPSPFDGLGISANYTYSTSSNVDLINQLTGDTLPYPFLSEHSFNIKPYYEKYGISIAVPVQYRSEYLVSAADRTGNPVFHDGELYVDARIGYEFRLGPVERFEIFAEGKNLTGEVDRLTAGDIRMTSLGYYGRRYFLGFRANF